jgi:hypothetical protein
MHFGELRRASCELIRPQAVGLGLVHGCLRRTVNYFAHGIRFLDRPWFLAGTALPDLLSVVDRRVRLRPVRVAPLADGSGAVEAELAAGVLQHFDDDHWFHKTRAFAEATAHLGRMFRDALGPGDGFRCGFLGHISCELLLDSILIERHPVRLDLYYAALQGLDAERLADATGTLAGQPVDLAAWLPRFCHEQFLRDYADPVRLAYRLNQVLRRIKLEPLPSGVETVLAAGRGVVETFADGLLPPSRFAVPVSNEAD